jgi:hypothetical protein
MTDQDAIIVNLQAEVFSLKKKLRDVCHEYDVIFEAYGITERETQLLRKIVRATYFAPEEGTTVPVFRVPSKELDKQITDWLLANGGERYVPKEKHK